MDRGHFPGFALDPGSEHEGAVPEIARCFLGCVDRQGIVADHLVFHSRETGIVLLGRLGDTPLSAVLEVLIDRGRQLLAELVMFHQFQAVRETGGVGKGGPRGNGVEGVADDVREAQRDHPGREGLAGEVPALHAREMLADGVDFVDGGAAGEQQLRGLLLFGQRDSGRRGGHEGRASPREQTDDQGVFVQVVEQGEHALGAGYSGFVGEGMAALGGSDMAEGKAVVVLGVDGAGRDVVAQNFLHGRGHGRGGLAGSHDDDFGELGERIAGVEYPQISIFQGQRTGNALPWVSGLERGAEDVQGIGALLCGVCSWFHDRLRNAA